PRLRMSCPDRSWIKATAPVALHRSGSRLDCGSMFLALRELRRTWRRFVLVGLVVLLVATLSTVLTGLANGLVTDGISGLRSLPLSHLAFAPHADATFSRSTLDRKALDDWREEPGAESTPIG